MLRWMLRGLTVLISLPIAYFLAALAGAVLPGGHAQIDGGPLVRIGLLRGPIHYDLVLPLTPETRARFGFAAVQGVPILNPGARNLVVGWGSRAFYTTTGTYADLRLATIWHAITGDAATLHLDVTGDLTGIDNLLWLDLSQTQRTALEQAVTATFSRDPLGQPQPLPVPPYGNTDAFYAAQGHFSALHTCNVWIGEMLRQSGLDFGQWTPTPQSVTLSAQWFHPAQS
ncbi:MAG: TIGR02117 family protein [bacterium]